MGFQLSLPQRAGKISNKKSLNKVKEINKSDSVLAIMGPVGLCHLLFQMVRSFFDKG